MKTLLQLAAVLALLVLSVSAAVLSFDAHRVLIDAHKTSANVRELIIDSDLVSRHAYASLTLLDSATENLSATIHEVNGAAENLKATSAAEQTYWNNTAKQTSLAARDMRQLIARTDRELNDKFLPDLDAQLTQTSTAAQFSFESLTKASDALTFQINDPAISQTLEAMHGISLNLQSATAHADDSLAHVDHTFAFYDKELTTPLGFWKTLGKTLLSTGSQAGNVYAGFFRPYPKP